MLGVLAPRAQSLIVLGALFCTLAVKLYIALFRGQASEYLSWIATDVAVLLCIELVLAAVCSVWPGKWVLRICLLIAAAVCTWSVMNAGWLIATGTQIIPAVLLPLIRDPLNTLAIVGVNLFYRPLAAVVLLGPSAVALAFFFTVLTKPVLAKSNHRSLWTRAVICAVFILAAVLVRRGSAKIDSGSITSQEMRYNCQFKAVRTLFLRGPAKASKVDLANAARKIPSFDEIQISSSPAHDSGVYNVVMVVLEGIGNGPSSVYRNDAQARPYLTSLAAEGVEFTNARCPVTHTTKALFSILTGRFCSVSQDIVEAIPVTKPYASLATILKSQWGFRTAFFQSAKGNFECRPGLIHNLGFEKFWARDDLGSDDAYVGYLGSDEFAMLEPMIDWVKKAERPFLLTVLCSVTHDPYKVPDWFGPAADEPIARFRQAVAYTDSFIEALDQRIARLNLKEQTIFCVVTDHGEAFGEHGLSGHARITFEETLNIVWIMRAPGLIKPGLKIGNTISSLDFTPTLLALLGLQVEGLEFDGINALEKSRRREKAFFSCWIQNGPAGFVQGRRKVVYDPINELAFEYDLAGDPNESARKELTDQHAERIIQEITAWRQATILPAPQDRVGRMRLFDRWLCNWNRRKAWAKYARDLPKSD